MPVQVSLITGLCIRPTNVMGNMKGEELSGMCVYSNLVAFVERYLGFKICPKGCNTKAGWWVIAAAMCGRAGLFDID